MSPPAAPPAVARFFFFSFRPRPQRDAGLRRRPAGPPRARAPVSDTPAAHPLPFLSLPSLSPPLPVDPTLSSSDSDTPSDPHLPRTASAVSSAGLDSDWPPAGVQFKSRGGGGKKKGKKDKARVDLYALLGLEHVRWTATDKQLRDAYKAAALVAHPDKAPEDEREAAETKFKALQAAYETLSDPAKRREFDSTDDFDDSLPVECAADDFFAVFGPAFRRNARWSAAPGPVPDLGDADTPWDAVDAFYEFWYGFKSWREFPHEDEEDVDGAESRDERRWLERHNARLREAGKKEERKRLRAFVEAAYELDPRVAARKAELKAARAARAMEKQAGRIKAEAEAAAAAAEAEARAKVEAEAAAVAAAAAKKVREREKKAAQKARARVRGSVGPLVDVEDVCTALDALALDALADAIAASDDGGEAALAAARDAVDAAKHAAAADKLKARSAASAAEAAAAAEAARARRAAWSEEEVRLLQKALTKIPTGTPKRWEAVAALVRTRDVDEVVDMVKHGLTAARYAPKQAGFEIAAKRAGAVAAAGGAEASRRDVAFTDVQVGRPGTPGTPATGKPPVAPPAPAAAAAVWSADDELALVRALKKHGKDDPDRWAAVAADTGKPAAACVRKFKEMKEAAKARKA